MWLENPFAIHTLSSPRKIMLLLSKKDDPFLDETLLLLLLSHYSAADSFSKVSS